MSAKITKQLTEQAIMLLPGETLNEFRAALSKAARGWGQETFASLSAPEEEGELCPPSIYLEEVLADAVVLEISQWRMTPPIDSLLRVPYSRSGDGTFAFGQWLEVRRVVSFAPVADDQRQLGEGATARASALEMQISREVHGEAALADDRISAIAFEHVEQRARVKISEERVAGRRVYVGDPMTISAIGGAPGLTGRDRAMVQACEEATQRRRRNL